MARFSVGDKVIFSRDEEFVDPKINGLEGVITSVTSPDSTTPLYTVDCPTYRSKRHDGEWTSSEGYLEPVLVVPEFSSPEECEAWLDAQAANI